MTRRVGAADDEPTLDPDLSDGAPPRDFTRHSTLTVRRLEVAGRRVVVKVATGRTRAPLRAEAHLVRLIGTQLAPEAVALREHDDRTDLVLDDVGRPLSERLMHLGGAERLLVLTRCARALGELHASGWAHGALCAQHVVLDDALLPRFVSLGSARPLTDIPTGREDDVRQLLELVRLCAAAPTTGSDGRGWRRLRRELERLADTSATEVPSSREVLSALERLDTPRPTRRPSSALAGLRDRLQVPGWARGHWGDGARARRLVTVASVVAILALAATLLPRLWNGQSAASGEASSAAVEPLAGNCSPVIAGVAGPPDDVRFDLTGDGCADVVRLDGSVLEINGLPYRVGLPGDRISVTDDDCDGTAQVHLARPATGEHFVFDRLATADAPAHARLIGQPPASRPAEDGGLGPCEHHPARSSPSTSPSPSTTSTGDPP